MEVMSIGEVPVLVHEADDAVHIEVAQLPEHPARLTQIGARPKCSLCGCRCDD